MNVCDGFACINLELSLRLNLEEPKSNTDTVCFAVGRNRKAEQHRERLFYNIHETNEHLVVCTVSFCSHITTQCLGLHQLFPFFLVLTPSSLSGLLGNLLLRFCGFFFLAEVILENL